MSSTGKLAGKSAIITGSSRGIGAAVARRLHEDGANVVINYVSNPDAAEKLVAELNGKRPKSAVAIRADLSKLDETIALVEKSRQAFGKINIYVLNAGIMGMKPLAQVDEAFYNAHFDVNVKAPFFFVKTIEPQLEAGDRIIFCSSSLTKFSLVPAVYIVYAGTKGAVEQFTRVLARDLGSRGVTVNCISPGPVDTEMFRQGKSPEQIKFFENLHPQKRIGETEEIANVVSFVAGPDSNWVNGQNILVNGGYHV